MRKLLFILPFLVAADWPQFRGPNGQAVSGEKNLPVKFEGKDGLRWKIELPARGISSPVIVGNKVFITCSSGVRDDRLHILAYDTATGEKLWHRQLAATGNTAAHPKTNMAAPTPVADANAVYCLFATGDLIACDHSGKVLWIRSLTGDYPTISNQVGMAASPVLAGDKLIVPMDNSGESFLAAIDVKNGKNIWKTPRSRDINWVTPVVREITSSDSEVLFQNAKELAAYDAKDGKKKWSHPVTGGSSPTPTLADGLLIASGGGLNVFKVNEKDLKEQWKSPKFNTGYSSALYYDNRVYAANPSTAIVFCIDVKTGKPIWEERIKGSKQTFSASPVAGDGKVYVLSETGTLTTFKAGDDAEVLGASELGEECLATPAIADGAIFIRTDKSLFCIGNKK